LQCFTCSLCAASSSNPSRINSMLSPSRPGTRCAASSAISPGTAPLAAAAAGGAPGSAVRGGMLAPPIDPKFWQGGPASLPRPPKNLAQRCYKSSPLNMPGCWEQPLGKFDPAPDCTTMHGSCMVAAWKVHGSCMEAARKQGCWPMHGSCMVAAWKLHGSYLGTRCQWRPWPWAKHKWRPARTTPPAGGVQQRETATTQRAAGRPRRALRRRRSLCSVAARPRSCARARRSPRAAPAAGGRCKSCCIGCCRWVLQSCCIGCCRDVALGVAGVAGGCCRVVALGVADDGGDLGIMDFPSTHAPPLRLVQNARKLGIMDFP
jgi:hypothetical protein